jgi:hypothetical protein
MPRQTALPPSLAPRLISREAAAAYLCVSPNKFDKMVRNHQMPAARLLGEQRRAWDVCQLDIAIDQLASDGNDNRVDETWNDVDAPQATPHVERNHVRGHTYLSFRRGKGSRIRLPNDSSSEDFMVAYRAALLGQSAPIADHQIGCEKLKAGMQKKVVGALVGATGLEPGIC